MDKSMVHGGSGVHGGELMCVKVMLRHTSHFQTQCMLCLYAQTATLNHTPSLTLGLNPCAHVPETMCQGTYTPCVHVPMRPCAGGQCVQEGDHEDPE